MKSENGFTLFEVMVATAISGFVLLAIHAIYKTQQESYAVQKQVSTMRQNLRGGMCCMQRDIRMCGYDPQASGNFGMTDISLDGNGSGTISFTLDDNLNRTEDESDGNGIVDNRETVVFSLYDYPTASPDGILDLGRKQGARRQLLAENIEALGFAYAFDLTGDGDNALDRDTNGNVIWAIDSDNNKELDVNLDTDNDGDIDVDDNPAGEALAHADNGSLPDVQISDIRAVRIWMLARGDKEETNFANSMIYVVSDQRIVSNDGYRRRQLTATIGCRNMGIRPNN